MFHPDNNGTSHLLSHSHNQLDSLIPSPPPTPTQGYYFYLRYKYVFIQAFSDSQFTISYAYDRQNHQTLLRGIG